MHKILFSILLLLQIHTISAQENGIKKEKGTFYLAWGYNRDWYSKSDIHFKNTSGAFNPETGNYDNYDFTIYNATASDRPDFDAVIHPKFSNLTIPQFNARMGYFFKGDRGWGIEINYDHAKYVMNDNQTLRVKGQIFGREIDKDTLISSKDFLHFEHTDGANFLLLNVMKRYSIFASKNGKFNIDFINKAGIGIVIPRTDVTLFGQRLNNNWHVAGWVTGIETGVRIDFFKHFFTEFTGKGVFADYKRVLVIGDGKASHQFFAAELIFNLGYQFKL